MKSSPRKMAAAKYGRICAVYRRKEQGQHFPPPSFIPPLPSRRRTSGRTVTVRSCPCKPSTEFLQLPPVSRAALAQGVFAHLRRRLEAVRRGSDLWVEVELEGAHDALEAEEVVSVRGDLDLHLVRLARGVLGVRRRLAKWEG